MSRGDQGSPEGRNREWRVRESPVGAGDDLRRTSCFDRVSADFDPIPSLLASRAPMMWIYGEGDTESDVGRNVSILQELRDVFEFIRRTPTRTESGAR